MVVIYWSKRIKHTQVGTGVFDCSYCKSQQRCSYHQVGIFLYLCAIIPFGEEQRLDEYVICKGCNKQFQAASYRDAQGSSAVEALTRDCPKYKVLNPNHPYRC